MVGEQGSVRVRRSLSRRRRLRSLGRSLERGLAKQWALHGYRRLECQPCCCDWHARDHLHLNRYVKSYL